jgi:hypothetical protein
VKARWPNVVAIVFWSVALAANTCIEPKPLRVRQLCGRVADPSGGVIPGVELQLIDSQKNVVARAEADDKGSFAFSQLQVGDYHLTTKTPDPGFMSLSWPVRVTKPRVTPKCKGPVTVVVAPWSCGGGVSQQGYRP